MPQQPLKELKIISAGAGSGKTYRLTNELVQLVKDQQVRTSGIIATTFTRKAAAELQERVRVKLLEDGMSKEADLLTNALIGTVHGLGVKLLRRFSFEAGVSPQVDILPDGEQQQLFNRSLASVLSLELIEEMAHLTDRLGLTKLSGFYDWRKEVKDIADLCRANNFSVENIQLSQQKSWESFASFLPKISDKTPVQVYEELKKLMEQTTSLLEDGDDQTKTTGNVAIKIRGFLRQLKRKGFLYWHQWAAVGKLSPGAKSRETVAPLLELAQQHESLSAFQNDVKKYIDSLFETAIAAIAEFQNYKTRRGLIDYTDMEVLVSQMLDHSLVKEVLADEIDLLLVDEFQDTSPIQLEIFLKLSQIAKQSIWVGDPKQSIYGFRGAEPALMEAIVKASGGIKPENIQTQSWRSRKMLVEVSNAIFKKAFKDTPPAQVTLDAVRTPKANKASAAEPADMDAALIHWHFATDDDIKRAPASPWFENALARSLAEWIDEKHFVFDKPNKEYRHARPGDVAILCRSNAACVKMAAALNDAGLRAAIAQVGLLDTAEVRLVMACLKYVLNEKDSLSVAEILLLAQRLPLEEIIEDRLAYLDSIADLPSYDRTPWAKENPFIETLNVLRPRLQEMSSAETLDLLLEQLDLRRCIVPWGNREQRLSNIDRLRELAREYESICNNTHSAASLGGFLLWLNNLYRNKEDQQGASADASAVNVLTYHRSKGLEWPVTICHSLEQPLRADLWRINLISDQQKIDLNNVLGGRWLRYWINPYADQHRNTPLIERLKESDEQKIKTQQALDEEIRVLYVGITRARDYLIFPTRANKSTLWLNRVCQNGEEKILTLDPNTHETQWDWKEKFIDKTTRIFQYPRIFTLAQQQEEDAPFLIKSSGPKSYAPFHISAKEELPATVQQPSYNSQVCGAPPNLPEGVDQFLFCKVAQLYLMALPPNLIDKEEQVALVEGIMKRQELLEVKANQVISFAASFQTYLEQHGAWATWQKRIPVRWENNGRLFETQIDWLLQTNQKSILGMTLFASQSKMKHRIKEQAAVFHYCKLAFLEAGLAAVEHCFVYVPSEGKVYEF